ncbi:MAG: alpha-L-fucosidase [Fimbriimonadaceae bacterium]|nr:alpha-L-fucosidase [Fimbriimonadaceae bacterium]
MSTGIARFGDGRDWFFEARYGLFIHWGLYAIHGWHEQEQWRGRVPAAEYVKLQAAWNPTAFDPDAWLDLLAEAGMRYLCVTTKHHDGFCLWDTQQTPFNTMNTPYGRDIIGQLAAACHRRGVPLCLYYSVADWHQPNYPNLGRHHELAAPKPGDEPDWDRYMLFLKAQVRELCSNYGELHGFWWDMNVPEHLDESVNALIRELQPQAVINNRGFDPGDFGTPERDYEQDPARSFDTPVEACQSVGLESWGYRAEESYYTDGHLLRSLDRYLARGANYLLNVGPRADGSIPPESAAILRRLGAWKAAVGEAFTATRPASHLVPNPQLLLTARDRTLYVHLVGPIGDSVKLKPLTTAPLRATLLNDGRPVAWATNLAPTDHLDQTGYLRLCGLPANEYANSVMVIKLEFAEPLQGPPTATTGDDLRVR